MPKLESERIVLIVRIRVFTRSAGTLFPAELEIPYL